MIRCLRYSSGSDIAQKISLEALPRQDENYLAAFKSNMAMALSALDDNCHGQNGEYGDWRRRKAPLEVVPRLTSPKDDSSPSHYELLV